MSTSRPSESPRTGKEASLINYYGSNSNTVIRDYVYLRGFG